MNKVSLVGRLVRDPEVRYSQGQNSTAVARFTLAVDRRFKKEGEANADFISCIAFGKTAEFIEKYFFKGMRLTDVVLDEVEFVESKSQSQDAQPQSADSDGFMSIPDGVDDVGLPFN